MGYIAKGKSRAEITAVARLVRRLQRAEHDLYFPILDFMEKTLPTLYPNFSFRIMEKEEMGEYEGLTFPEKNEIWIRADVYDSAETGDGRARLTIAHELFHYLCHSKSTVAFARTGSKLVPPYADPEWQADAFGGELLVSRDLVKNLSVDEIVKQCGGSKRAATVQYRAMNK